jgi:hypothetical protein
MTIEDVKVVYERYDLPPFDEVQKELEVGGIEVDKWDFLNGLCRSMTAKLNAMISYVTPFFIPSGHYAMYIGNMMKDDKETVAEAQALYKELMIAYHQALKAQVLSPEKQVEAFNTFWKLYPGWKERTLKLLDVCEDIFTREEKKVDRGYLG